MEKVMAELVEAQQDLEVDDVEFQFKGCSLKLP